MVQYDREFAAASSQTPVVLDTDGTVDFDGTSGGVPEDDTHSGVYSTMGPKAARVSMSHYVPRGSEQFREVPTPSHPVTDISFHTLNPTPPSGQGDSMQPTISTLQQQFQHAPNYQSPWEQDTSYPQTAANAATVVGALEKLKIEDSGVGEFCIG